MAKQYPKEERNRILDSVLAGLDADMDVLMACEQATWEWRGKTRTGAPYNSVRRWLREAGIVKRIMPGDVMPMLPKAEEEVEWKPGVYVLSAAQNDADIHEPFLRNLEAYCFHRGATLLIAPFTYDHRVHQRTQVQGRPVGKLKHNWHFRLAPYLTLNEGGGLQDYIALGPKMIFVSGANIQPTAAAPLNGTQGFPPGRSCVIPHSTIAMRVDPAMVAPAHRYTTGCVTQRHYIQKRIGLKADHHHVYGASVVEIGEDGKHFVRQINALDADGSFQDLEWVVRNGRVSEDGRAEVVVPGDLHIGEDDYETMCAVFNKGGIIDTMKPDHVMCHDAFDGRTVNRHTADDPFVQLELDTENRSRVDAEFNHFAAQMRSFANSYPETTFHILQCNHDDWLLAWIKRNRDWTRLSWPNQDVYLDLVQRYRRHVKECAKDHVDPTRTLLRVAMEPYDLPDNIQWIKRGESFMVRGVEQGMHGDLGVNGSRGSATGLARDGGKCNVGHSHTPAIVQGVCQAGTCSKLRQRYNKGPSNWSHTHIVQYPETGKRTLITTIGDQWRMEPRRGVQLPRVAIP